MEKKQLMERTEANLMRHLEDLNDEIDRHGGHIMDHMVLDGIKDVMKSLKCLTEIMKSNGTTVAAKVAGAV